jgi:hypothetical protein
MRSALLLAFTATACAARLSTTATAQHPLYTFPAHAPSEQFGCAVAALGDVNHDGLADFAIGEGQGSATVFSQCSGSFFVWGGGCAYAHHVPPRL